MTDKRERSLYLFYFLARSAEKPKWFQLGRPALAQVYAHMQCLDLDEGKRILAGDMDQKGYTVEKFLQGVLFETLGYPPEIKKRIESSLKGRARYMFYGLSVPEFEMKMGISKPPKITSRYAGAGGVVIDLARIPKALHSIVPYAKKWAITDDVERAAYLSHPSSRKKEFYRAVNKKAEAIESYCHLHRKDNPVPDEVVLFDLMMEAYSDIFPGDGLE